MNSLYFDVPYNEKDYVKKHGARWDPEVKSWYCENKLCDGMSNYIPFLKWILNNKSDIIIAMQEIYIVETKRVCWKCGKKTPIVTFGLCKYVGIENDDGKIKFDDHYGKIPEENDIRLAWVNNEEQIPPLLLHFLKDHFNVKMGYSSVAGRYFANHCEHCNSIQGNNYIFMEPFDSPFPMKGFPDYDRKLNDLTVYEFVLCDDLILDWYVYEDYCFSRDARVEFRKNVSLNGKDRFFDYGMLYCKY